MKKLLILALLLAIPFTGFALTKNYTFTNHSDILMKVDAFQNQSPDYPCNLQINGDQVMYVSPLSSQPAQISLTSTKGYCMSAIYIMGNNNIGMAEQLIYGDPNGHYIFGKWRKLMGNVKITTTNHGTNVIIGHSHDQDTSQ